MALHFSHREVNTSGELEAWYWDSDNESFTIKTTWNVGNILETNKRQQIQSLDQRYGKEMLHCVADIPNGVIVKLKKEHNIDIFKMQPEDERKLRRLLDDPEYRYLKTTTKKLSR